MENEIHTQNTDIANAPDWIVKTPKGYGRNSRLQRIGMAWNRPKDGGICIRTYGTQIIENDVYLFPVEKEKVDIDYP